MARTMTERFYYVKCIMPAPNNPPTFSAISTVVVSLGRARELDEGGAA
jgi:hypothetical protein